MRAWGLPEEFWVQERVQLSPSEKSWQALRRSQFRGKAISRGTAIAERPKLHLQPIIDAARQGAHRLDLRKQELWIIGITKEKCELYFILCVSQQNSLQKYGENHAKSIAFGGISTIFALPVVGGNTCCRGKFPLTTGSANTEEICELLRRFLQCFFKGVLLWNTHSQFFAVFCSFSQHIFTVFHSFSHVASVFAAQAT